MFLRVFSFLIVSLFFTSCGKFSFSKNDENLVLDTIVDFSSVDTFPSFDVCDSLFEKQEKETCFRNTIHQMIGVELDKSTLTIKDSIDEIVYVDVIINAEGMFSLDAIQSSEKIKNELPQLDSLLKASVKSLPNISPANKRGIPVTTKYSLPIIIKL